MVFDIGFNDEDEAWQIALGDHPELKALYENEELPEEIIEDDGSVWNPMMHLQMHAIVERQIRHDEPAGVSQIAEQLDELGVSRHDIRHAMAEPLAGQIWYMLKEGCPFDEQRYLTELRDVVQTCS